MGHTKFEHLQDLKAELNQIRRLPGIKEKKPGIFYLKLIPFLHFHDSEGERWADVKNQTGKGWLRLEIPFSATSTEKKKLLSQILKSHKALFHVKRQGD